jgi:hypothetical protein
MARRISRDLERTRVEQGRARPAIIVSEDEGSNQPMEVEEEHGAERRQIESGFIFLCSRQRISCLM